MAAGAGTHKWQGHTTPRPVRPWGSTARGGPDSGRSLAPGGPWAGESSAGGWPRGPVGRQRAQDAGPLHVGLFPLGLGTVAPLSTAGILETQTGGHPPLRLRVRALWGSAQGGGRGPAWPLWVGADKVCLPRPTAAVVIGFSQSVAATGPGCCSSALLHGLSAGGGHGPRRGVSAAQLGTAGGACLPANDGTAWSAVLGVGLWVGGLTCVGATCGGWPTAAAIRRRASASVRRGRSERGGAT